MQYSVPQFTDVEDKIIGPLTLKQFLILLVGGFLVFGLYKIMPNFALFLLVGLPVGGLAAILAFGKFNNRPIDSVFGSFIAYMFDSRAFVFKKQAPDMIIHTTEAKKPTGPPELSAEEKRSRLQKLSYILNQNVKTEEEMVKERFLHGK